MANLIELAKSYVPMLDEVYKLASCTSDLDGAPELARQGANANELIIPMLEMDGLADYDRNGGYVAGDVKMENRTVQCNFDRGRMFTVDTMDNAETAGLAFGRLAAEFIRTKVVPELDAFRFACYAGKPGISSAEATLSSGADVIAAISAAVTEMDENEVPSDQRHLRITSTLLRAIKDMDSYKSREVLESFASVKPVPQRRFYTAIEQLSGKDGEKAGGFRKYGKHYVKCAQADITDLRMDENVCGVMRDGITGIPTAQLQEQAQQLIEQLRTELQGVKDQTGLMLKSVYDADNDGEVDMHGETF